MRKIHLLPPLLALCFVPLPVEGTVKLALAAGASCNLCHVTPLGGGMRNAYGFEEVILGDLPRVGKRKSLSRGFTTKLNDFLRWGADVRLMALRYDTTATRKEAETILFPMQATAYVHVTASESLDFYVAHYLLQAQTEFWVRFSRRSGRAYVRTGRFLPSYGIRLDDHTSYIRGGNVRGLLVPELVSSRQGFPFGPTFHGMGIIEGGIYLGAAFLTGHVASPSIFPPINTTAKDAQAGLRLEVMKFLGGVTAMAGGSYLRERKLILRGMFTGLNWRGVTLLGEMDWAYDWEGPDVISRAAYGELDVLLRPGWRVFLKFDEFDADLDAHGAETLTRWTVGGELFPMPLIELKPQVRYSTHPRSGSISIDYLLQLHVFM